MVLLLALGVQTIKSPLPGYKLAWNEEFSYEGLPDPKRWDYEVGFVRNQEVQFYPKARLENSMVHKGSLILTARKDGFEGHEVTSGSIHTHGKYDFKYGYVEVRAKIPTGKGTWPAIWMLGSNIDKVGWPLCGEIDMMENVGWDANNIHFNVHCKGANKGDHITIENPSADFHLYGLEWTKDKLTWYFDGKPVMDFTKESDDPAKWPFDAPQYLILNLAVGGNWGGQRGIDAAIYPSKYEVDYVRVFQKP